MVLEGGVAGAQPLHKGGRLRPTAHRMKGREKHFRFAGGREFGMRPIVTAASQWR